MNTFSTMVVILLGLGMSYHSSARAEQVPPPVHVPVCAGHLDVAGYPNLSGDYSVQFNAPSQALVVKDGVSYVLTCKTEGPMGEQGCAENVHVGYNSSTGQLDGAYSLSNSDTGQVYLGVDYGPGHYVQIGTLNCR